VVGEEDGWEEEIVVKGLGHLVMGLEAQAMLM
jgi:hypothetical protein